MVEFDKYTPVEWAKKACDKLIETFSADELSAEMWIQDYKGRKWLIPGGYPKMPELDFYGARWRYNHGLFMVALQELYKETGIEKYLEYTKQWADGRIDENGKICVDVKFLDSIQPGLALFLLYEKFGDERYKKALDYLNDSFNIIGKTSEGGYWHNNTRPHQMWLDGLYMAQPFIMKYGAMTGDADRFKKVAKQIRLMTKYTKDEKTGLLYHGWDESKEAVWADKETGRSSVFWGRAIGWYCFTLVDILEQFPKDLPEYEEIKGYLVSILEAILRYQDQESGMWYQVVNEVDKSDNWLETSCSCLFMYTLAKSIRLGYIDKKYIENVRRCYRGLFNHIECADEGFILFDVCSGTNVGENYEFYIKRSRICNDYHGIGIFVLACLEYQKSL